MPITVKSPQSSKNRSYRIYLYTNVTRYITYIWSNNYCLERFSLALANITVLFNYVVIYHGSLLLSRTVCSRTLGSTQQMSNANNYRETSQNYSGTDGRWVIFARCEGYLYLCGISAGQGKPFVIWVTQRRYSILW